MVSEVLSSNEQDPPLMASSSSSSSGLPSNLGLLISNLNSLITVKLDSTNFIIWKNQLYNILSATDLLCSVDGLKPCPPIKIKDINGVETANPEVIHWKLIDSHLLSCTTATLSPQIYA